MALVGAGVGIEHDDAVIGVAVGGVYFVGGGIDRDVGG
jgi:hypothetical protein